MEPRVGKVFDKVVFDVKKDEKQEKKTGDKSFAEILKKSISEVNRMQIEAKEALEALATGKEKDIQKVMITLQKADVSLRMLMEVRNKAIEAYQEIMRMQV